MADKMDNNTKKKKSKHTKKKKHVKPVTYTKSFIRKDKNLINKYHALTKMQEAIKKAKGLTKEERLAKLEELSCKIEKLGGIEAYQKASKLGERRSGGFNSAKWVMSKLKEHDVQASLAGSRILKLLDVGALASNYSKNTWIDCTAIDLNPQNSSVIKADFLNLSSRVQYDVVVLSLVINFEGDPHRRGEMLTQCTKIVSNDGYLFVVLPLPCVENSRFFSKELFLSMTGSLGFTLTAEHCSKRLYFAMLKNNGDVNHTSFQRKTLRTGRGYNNFTVIL